MADRFRAVVRWWVGGEELAERTIVQPAGGIFVPGRAPPQRATEAYMSTPQGASEEVSRPGAKRPRPVVGHPGLEPGANGLRTQRLALHKALFVSDSDILAPAIAVTKGHHATYSGHRDRLDRAGLRRPSRMGPVRLDFSCDERG